VTVVLRVVLDERGQIVHGDIVEVDNRIRGRLLNWTELVRWLRWYVRVKRTSSRGAAEKSSATESPRQAICLNGVRTPFGV